MVSGLGRRRDSIGMTTLFHEDWVCEHCGSVSEQSGLASTSAFGACDLDTRPPDPERSALGYELACCPRCGFVGPSDPDPDNESHRDSESVAETVGSEAYQRQLRDSDLPEVANRYLCRALIEAGCGDLASAGWQALRAAWACDDADKDTGAKACRERALEIWARAEEHGQEIVEGGRPTTELLQADLERRVGKFGSARERCRRGLADPPEEPLGSFLEFELQLVGAADMEAHSLAEIVGGASQP